jgi:membrane protein YdbS with pleckstrin-like domain
MSQTAIDGDVPRWASGAVVAIVVILFVCILALVPVAFKEWREFQNDKSELQLISQPRFP